MDGLSAEERRLIDEAVAEGRVQKVPQGVSSGDEEMRWNPDLKRLEFVDKNAAERRRRGAIAAHWGKKKPGPPTSPDVLERRERVKDLVAAGKSGPEIAEATGYSQATIYQDVKKLGLKITRKVSRGAARSRFDPKVERRRQQVKEAHDGKRTVSEISEITGINRRTVVDHMAALGLKAPHGKPGRSSPAVSRRREEVQRLVGEGKTVRQVSEALGASVAVIRLDCKQLGLSPVHEPRKRKSLDKAANRKARAAEEKVAKVADRRRFKTVPVPMGDPAVMAPADATGTIFPGRVFEPVDEEPVLKDGCNQSKIGGDVLVGRLKGARIYTLTIEERATCPMSCRHWRSCYGNSMPHSRRWRHGPALIDQIDREIADLCARHEQVLIRLHVLGDFWSVEYVNFWGHLLSRFPNLHAFGFTAHKRGTEIGDRIALIRKANPDRFWIRHSDMTGPWGSFTIDFPTQQKTIGDAVVCPEQRDGMSGERKGTHCGNCAVCWSSPVPVAFVTH